MGMIRSWGAVSMALAVAVALGMWPFLVLFFGASLPVRAMEGQSGQWEWVLTDTIFVKLLEDRDGLLVAEDVPIEEDTHLYVPYVTRSSSANHFYSKYYTPTNNHTYECEIRWGDPPQRVRVGHEAEDLYIDMDFWGDPFVQSMDQQIMAGQYYPQIWAWVGSPESEGMDLWAQAGWPKDYSSLSFPSVLPAFDQLPTLGSPDARLVVQQRIQPMDDGSSEGIYDRVSQASAEELDQLRLVVSVVDAEAAIGLNQMFRMSYVYKLEGQAAAPAEGWIEQEETTMAQEDAGEDGGGFVLPDIVEGAPDFSSDAGGNGGRAAAAGAIGLLGAAAAAGALAGGKDEDGGGDGEDRQEEKPRSRYKMYVNKDFGDRLKKGEKPRPVYARMVEVTPQGWEKERDDLSRRIQIYSGDGSLKVEDGGFTSNGYRGAWVSVPEGSSQSRGQVSFAFEGEGGRYIRHVVFRLTEAKICFAEENKGLPAFYEKEVGIAFSVLGLEGKLQVEAWVEAHRGRQPVYDVRLEQHKDLSNVYFAYIRDIEMRQEDGKTPPPEPGTTTEHRLCVRAAVGEQALEGHMPIYRIHLGLRLCLEGDALGCYLRVNPLAQGRAGIRAAGRDLADNLSVTGLMGLNPMAAMLEASFQGGVSASKAATDQAVNLRPEDYAPCTTKGRLLLLSWNEEKKEIERISVLPDRGACQVEAVQVENSEMAHGGAAQARHQGLVDSLGIWAFPTKEVDAQGARIIELSTTRAALDPPTRIRVKLRVAATYQGRQYKVEKEVLLHSMPMRDFALMAGSEQDRLIAWDDHVREMLLSIQSKIYSSYMYHLFSLHDLIERMLNGYDRRFGYDTNQVNTVMEVWTGFLKGEKTGARGEAEKVSLSDDLQAYYAFMEGMRDNGGILGRIALGVCSAGYSELVFTAMDIGEKMQAAVMSCKGDREFGFWDGMQLGIREYVYSELQSLAFGTALKGANMMGSAIIGEAIGKADLNIADSITKSWRSAMDGADEALRKSSKVYSGGAKALDQVKNFLNVGSGAAKGALDRNAQMDEAAQRHAQTTIAQRRMGMGDRVMSDAEWNAREIMDIAKARGMDKLRDLDLAQKRVAMSRRGGGDFWEAKADYAKKAEAVWTDKNALKQLKALEGSRGTDMRIEFNKYRNGVQQRVLEKTLDDLAAETGKSRANLYVNSVTGNSQYDELSGKVTAEDLDVSITEVNYSDPTREDIYLVLDKDMADKALARNLYKEVNGVEAASIEEALDFKQKHDITYVQPLRMKGQELEWDMEAFMDVKGMLDPAAHGRALRGLEMNRQTIAHKGMERYQRGDALEAQAKDLLEQAKLARGEVKAQLEARALDLQVEAYAEYVEGTRQITKMTNKSSIPRNAHRMAKGHADAFGPRERYIHALGQEVGKDLSPGEFFQELEAAYGMDKRQYTKVMADCLN